MGQNQKQLPSSVHYTVDEVVAILGISKSTLYELRSRGEAPPSYKIGGRRFFEIAGLHEWLDNKANNAETRRGTRHAVSPTMGGHRL